jgi:hypothetical protein
MPATVPPRTIDQDQLQQELNVCGEEELQGLQQDIDRARAMTDPTISDVFVVVAR